MATNIMEPKVGNLKEDLAKVKQADTSSTSTGETENSSADKASDKTKNYIAITVYAVIALVTIWAMRTGRMARPFLAGFLVGGSVIGIINSTSSIIKSNKTA